MSRIGKSPITIPEGVTVDHKDGFVTVKGKLGELKQEVKDNRACKSTVRNENRTLP